jgi:hypothetical protein
MNKTLSSLFGFCFLLSPLAIGRGQTSTRGQRTRGIPYVSGTNWQTCGDWNNSDKGFRRGYLIGHMEAVNQALPYLRQTMSGSGIKNHFEMPEGVKIEDYKKSLDNLCRDSLNAKISVANAFGIVQATLAGRSEANDQMLRTYRCIGAGGDDTDKINECFGIE